MPRSEPPDSREIVERAELEHRVCIEEWEVQRRKNLKYRPKILHTIEAHYPPPNVWDMGKKKWRFKP